MLILIDHGAGWLDGGGVVWNGIVGLSFLFVIVLFLDE
jgi:hypothetical protein